MPIKICAALEVSSEWSCQSSTAVSWSSRSARFDSTSRHLTIYMRLSINV